MAQPAARTQAVSLTCRITYIRKVLTELKQEKNTQFEFVKIRKITENLFLFAFLL